MEEIKKLYSKRAITITTAIGSPLAAGILIRENYKTLHKEKEGQIALIVGIVTTILLFVIIYSIPDNIMNRTPNAIIPAIYTLIIALIVEKIQGQELKTHKENNLEFQSLWKAAGIGAICLVVILAVIALIAFISGDLSDIFPKYDTVAYDKKIAQFTENETTSLKIFKLTETPDSVTIMQELKNGLSLWKVNKLIIESASKLKDLPKALTIQNEKLNRYCDLRIEHFTLILKAQTEKSEKYSTQINEIGAKIDNLIADMNK